MGDRILPGKPIMCVTLFWGRGTAQGIENESWGKIPNVGDRAGGGEDEVMMPGTVRR